MFKFSFAKMQELRRQTAMALHRRVPLDASQLVLQFAYGPPFVSNMMLVPLPYREETREDCDIFGRFIHVEWQLAVDDLSYFHKASGTWQVREDPNIVIYRVWPTFEDGPNAMVSSFDKIEERLASNLKAMCMQQLEFTYKPFGRSRPFVCWDEDDM